MAGPARLQCQLMKKVDVCIRGAGMVGKTLALLLARERLQVALVRGPDDQHSEGSQVDIRSYALNAASQALLQDLKVWPSDSRQACAIEHMRVSERAGAALAFDAPPQAAALAHIVDAAVLDEQLELALRYQSGIAIVEDSVPAHLTAACEGRDSTSRAEWGVAYRAHPYGQHAIATHLYAKQHHAQTAYQWFGEQGDVLALLPRHGLPADAEGGCTVALVWAVAPARAQALLALEPDAFCRELESACDHTLGSMRLIAHRAVWPLRLGEAERWCGEQNGKSWVLLGDAAHAMHPLAGQGLNVGLADAQALAHHLAQRASFRQPGDLRLLRAWERERRQHWQQMRLATDGLQRLFSHPSPAAQMLRHWGLRGFNALTPLKQWAAHQAAQAPKQAAKPQ